MAKRCATYLCFGYQQGVTPLTASPATTAECEPHEPSPDGYTQFFEWAGWMARNGHTERRCRGCHLYLIWEPGVTADACLSA